MTRIYYFVKYFLLFLYTSQMTQEGIGILPSRSVFCNDKQSRVLSSSFAAEKPDVKATKGIEYVISQLRYFAKKGRLIAPNDSEIQLEATLNAPYPVRAMRAVAAQCVLLYFLTSSHREQVQNLISDYLYHNPDSTRVVLTRNTSDQTKDISWNFLAPAYTKWLEKAAIQVSGGREVVSISVMRVNDTNRNSAGHVQRITNMPRFQRPSGFKEGDAVVIVDEHVQSGGLVLGLYSMIKQYTPADVIGFCTLTAHPETQNLKPSSELVNELKQAINEVNPELESMILARLEDLGLSFNTLVNRDLLTILSIVIGTGDRYRRIRERFAGMNAFVTEGKADNREKGYTDGMNQDQLYELLGKKCQV